LIQFGSENMTTQEFINSRYDRVKDYDVTVRQMEERTVNSLPKVENVKYNEVLTLDVAFLFCDIKGYTNLVTNSTDPKTIARIMSIYVTEMAAAIRYHGGTILSIRGDGIIGAFIGSNKNNASTEAARCSVTQYSLLDLVVNKRLRSFQQSPISCHWGADYGKVKITRAGIHGDGKNDLIYIGDAINYTSKFSVLADKGSIVISSKMHNSISNYYKDPENGWKWNDFYDHNYGTLYSKSLTNWSGLVEPS